MADQSLQAFQLGANLFDRAQTQARMMEQLQLQAADQIMRQRQYDLQNKIQSKANTAGVLGLLAVLAD